MRSFYRNGFRSDYKKIPKKRNSKSSDSRVFPESDYKFDNVQNNLQSTRYFLEKS